jgi:hypothetical protein
MYSASSTGYAEGQSVVWSFAAINLVLYDSVPMQLQCHTIAVLSIECIPHMYNVMINRAHVIEAAVCN